MSHGYSKYAAGTNTGPLYAQTSGTAYARSDTPSSFRIPPRGMSSLGSELGASTERITQRIAETREWLHQMQKEVRRSRRRQRVEEKSASLVCSVLRASSAILTGMAARQHASSGGPPYRFRYALESFLDGTPFLTPQALCRYNTAVAEMLSDEHLELLRRYVFDYDEAAFADLLYADEVVPDAQHRGPHGADTRVLEAVRSFNERARRALERLFVAPGGLVDATMRAALLVPVVADEGDEDYDEA
ncbi:hypothetical protein DQ04_01341070 [Trypanosoma grayi]|uniref:hypothetical protein n=1 Tax=Trypanosoma grayi TaxID=71804 RepID=UPI0004F48F09|nr:hypothetical protein DQ04_01341070 [Trypanosoma grayi]KEG12905.1 hypothetical protein DQ04_01341070 [Trypanosoma grayi]